MSTQVILIEDNPKLAESMNAELKKSPEFVVAATYKKAAKSLRLQSWG